MKKFLLSVGALLLAAGLGLSWVGVRMGGETMATVRLFGRTWNVYAPSTGWGIQSTTHNAEYAEAVPTASLGQAGERADDVAFAGEETTPFTSISLDVDLGNVTITKGDDFGVEIKTWGSGYEVEHWYSGDTLYIESADSGRLLADNCGSEITVYVGSGVWLESLYVDLDLGDLTLAGLQIEYADIELDLGNLTGEALTVTTSFHVDADLGAVDLFGDLGEYVDISADLGSVQLGLSRPESEYSWELEADMGSITVDGRKQRVNDENEVIGGYGNRTILVDASLGSITVDFDQDFSGEATQAGSAPATAEDIAVVTEDKGTMAAPDSVWAETAG